MFVETDDGRRAQPLPFEPQRPTLLGAVTTGIGKSLAMVATRLLAQWAHGSLLSPPDANGTQMREPAATVLEVVKSSMFPLLGELQTYAMSGGRRQPETAQSTWASFTRESGNGIFSGSEDLPPP